MIAEPKLDDVEDISPLSPMQELMLMHSIRVPGSSSLVNQFCYQLNGPLDVQRFQDAWQAAVDKHPALRTLFVYRDVEFPVQICRTVATFKADFIDLSEDDEAARQARIHDIMQADRLRGIDLLRAPLMRGILIKSAPEEHVFIWTRHHLILDLWSVDCLFREVFQRYNDPQDTNVEPHVLGFSEYVNWIEEQDPEQLAAYWKAELRGHVQPSLLIKHHRRRAQWSQRGQLNLRRTVETRRAEELFNFAKSNGLTLGTCFQAALALVLVKQLQRDDVVFGMTVSGRPQKYLVSMRFWDRLLTMSQFA